MIRLVLLACVRRLLKFVLPGSPSSRQARRKMMVRESGRDGSLNRKNHPWSFVDKDVILCMSESVANGEAARKCHVKWDSYIFHSYTTMDLFLIVH